MVMFMKKVILECKLVHFFTQLDEEIFFTWLKRIQCISKIEGQGTVLYLEISSSSISDNDLNELLAVFSRYKIDLKQLQQFITKSNEYWVTQWINEGPDWTPPEFPRS